MHNGIPSIQVIDENLCAPVMSSTTGVGPAPGRSREEYDREEKGANRPEMAHDLETIDDLGEVIHGPMVQFTGNLLSV